MTAAWIVSTVCMVAFAVAWLVTLRALGVAEEERDPESYFRSARTAHGVRRRRNRRAFWWGFTHPFSDARMASRELTHREERHLARQFTHRQRPWWSCWGMSRRFCVRCIWRDVTGINRRAKRRYVEQMRERAKLAPPSATIRFRRNFDGTLDRVPSPAMRVLQEMALRQEMCLSADEPCRSDECAVCIAAGMFGDYEPETHGSPAQPSEED